MKTPISANDARLKLADDVTFQSLGPGEDTVVLSLNSGYLYTGNETAAAFLRAVEDGRTLSAATDLLLDEFDVPRETLSRDLAELAAELIREKLIVEEH